jgi:hypothetical protein
MRLHRARRIEGQGEAETLRALRMILGLFNSSLEATPARHRFQ